MQGIYGFPQLELITSLILVFFTISSLYKYHCLSTGDFPKQTYLLFSAFEIETIPYNSYLLKAFLFSTKLYISIFGST